MDNTLTKIIAALDAGQPVVMPTDTVFGIMADATNKAAVEALYKAKNRPDNQPSQLLVADMNAANRWAELPPAAQPLANTHWPGAATLLVPATKQATTELAPQAISADGLVGVRVPDHPLLLQLLAAFGRPLLASSANKAAVEYVNDLTAIQAIFPDLLCIEGQPAGHASAIFKCTGNEVETIRVGTSA